VIFENSRLTARQTGQARSKGRATVGIEQSCSSRNTRLTRSAAETSLNAALETLYQRFLAESNQQLPTGANTPSTIANTFGARFGARPLHRKAWEVGLETLAYAE
jgi:hypothetical protein